ncbi:response regulator [Inhella gelatinilytica]|uniref:Response regulator n=1 Tax=Inhella gelatinilytica TaxID=2795030 RepID=A0A931NDN4_9BURK|nr:response regulator [Inhella gelatinilytica]MBH9551631.1 response regulator [Inhella gelatinilytica]
MTPAKLRFLIVDPLEGVRAFAQRLLEGFGFAPDHIRGCADPDSALLLATEWAPDFVFTDAFSGQSLDGLALFESIRALHPQCRLGLMSFEITPELEARAKALNARFIQRKPFTAETLRATVQASLEWMRQERPDLAARMVRESKGRLDPSRRIELPPVQLPQPFKVGDQVQHAGQRRKVLAVVLRQGEQALQLDGVPGFVPAAKVNR